MKYHLLGVDDWGPKEAYFSSFYEALNREDESPFSAFLAGKLVVRYEQLMSQNYNPRCLVYQDYQERTAILKRMVNG